MKKINETNKTNKTNKTNQMKRLDNQYGKVKNAGKVIGGICGVVVLAGMAVTAFAAGQKETAASDGGAGNFGTSAVGEVSPVRDADAYWMKQMSVSGLDAADTAVSSDDKSAVEDIKGDDTRKKALKKSFQEVNDAFQKQKAEMEKKEADWNDLLKKVKDWSNSTFRNELDKLAESMQIICDQLSTIQDDCYYNLDALKYGSEQYDADYEKWDSIFEKAASIQRRHYLQLDHVYQKIADETVKAYEKNGLKRNDQDQEYYYNGKKVRYFEDGVWDDQSFSGSMSSGNSGEVDVFATRDKNGDLTGFEVYGIENTKDWVKEHYSMKEYFSSGGSSDSDRESAS
ncbi:hypothetical protein [Robinsoniella sp.]|uniref:hypothetical protein n=1 Tax=Robinsoniella sp. TaxID=2496533 RepID=UPI003750A5EE